jgi:uncharacterized membrane protein YidH (DUF202 family)
MFETIAYAKSFDEVVGSINKTILNPLIQFSFIIAFVVFIWGVMEYLRNANNPTEREKGQKHMIWGIIGLVIMLGVYGIMNILINTFGLSKSHTIDGKQQVFTPPALKEIKIPKIEIKK